VNQEEINLLAKRLVQIVRSGQGDAAIHQAMLGIEITAEEAKALGAAIKDAIRQSSGRKPSTIN
jgi:hypothetical protein